VNWPTWGLIAATSTVSLGVNRASKSSGGCSQFHPSNSTLDQNFWETAMKNKLMFFALGYALLLAALGFALDAGIAGMIVYSD